ncbi:MAG: hypothetical protein COB83_08095 [Gammaproteobacteria bacterium]|nr:MAG: hypothetical protein COB83_08095 [Gammaproteobacteria bacterium]
MSISAATRAKKSASMKKFHAKKKAAAKKPVAKKTWHQFMKGKMGPYMKSEGGHAAAMRRLAKEYKIYKAK